MYHCHEILYRVYSSYDELAEAVNKYPFKGGVCRLLPEENKLNWKADESTRRLSFDACRLSDKRFDEFQFNEKARVAIGECPNGATVYITLFRG